MGIFAEITEQFTNIDKAVIEAIWNDWKNDLDWELGDWIDPPYVREAWAEILTDDVEILVVGSWMCDEIYDIHIEDVKFNGKYLSQDFFSHLC